MRVGAVNGLGAGVADGTTVIVLRSSAKAGGVISVDDVAAAVEVAEGTGGCSGSTEPEQPIICPAINNSAPPARNRSPACDTLPASLIRRAKYDATAC